MPIKINRFNFGLSSLGLMVVFLAMILTGLQVAPTPTQRLQPVNSTLNTSQTRAVDSFRPELTPILNDWNKAEVSRINLVVISSIQAITNAELSSYAERILTLDGQPILLNMAGNITANPSQVRQLGFGPFSIEPLKSAKSKFNFWYLSNRPPDITNLELMSTLRQPVSTPEGQVLAHLLPVFFNSTGGSRAALPAVSNLINITDTTSFQPGQVYLETSLDNFKAGLTLTHELGHALFGLRDEYGLQSDQPVLGYPNCARDAAEAKIWWGRYLDQIDPFYREWRDILTRYQLWDNTKPNSQQVRVSYVYSGCGESINDSQTVRPTQISIMDDTSQVPIFGSVNRARAEQILNLF